MKHKNKEKLNVQTLLAINYVNKLKVAKNQIKQLEKKLEKTIDLIPKRELDVFIKTLT